MAELAEVPGIEQADVTALAGLGLHTTDDLLRTERNRLIALIPGLTRSRVLGWQAVSDLNQLDGISLADAARLLAAGADSTEEASRWPLSRWQRALPDLPSDTVAAYLADAVRLRYTGVLNGTVRLRGGAPVAGAAVTVAGDRYTSDAMGRFRAIRLALDRRVAVTAHHPDLGYRLVKAARVMRPGALEGMHVVLPGAPRPAAVLSQRLGDVLPQLGSSRSTVRVVPDPPPHDEVLLVLSLAGRGARTVSIFLTFDTGRFVRSVYDLDRTALPAGTAVGDHLSWFGGGWSRARLNADDVARRVRLRRARRRVGAPATTAEAAAAQASTLLAAASDGVR